MDVDTLLLCTHVLSDRAHMNRLKGAPSLRESTDALVS